MEKNAENVFYNLYEPFTADRENEVIDLADSIAENTLKWTDFCRDGDTGKEYMEFCFGVSVEDSWKFIEKGFDY